MAQPPPPPSAATEEATPASIVWQSAAYTLYHDKLVQGQHTARALSRTELTSDYQSPAYELQSPQVNFKFSLNGQDNELPPGQHHSFVVLPNEDGTLPETPPIVFGQQYQDGTPLPADAYLAPNAPLKIRLDLRPLLAAFESQGFYTLYNGQQLYKDDLRHVYVVGSAPPLNWDFAGLANLPQLELLDPDGNGIYETTVQFCAPAEDNSTATSHWKQSLGVSEFSQYTSDYTLLDALYNLALEEAKLAVEPDGTFRTGQEWAGVWTRDISYSIILAQAALQPEVAKTSLLRKVTRHGRIVQDTGTGGAYPCSTDRVIWATAAWEIYLTTGDEDWLKQVYPIIRRSVEDDQLNAYNPATGLVRGESSFLDWREQTYPSWMQPADIYQSECLGTNAAHYQANAVLALMAARLGDAEAATQHQAQAENIKAAINQHLWLPDKGYYGQYRYGRTYPILSPRAEALGEALTVLFGIADAERSRSVVARTPVMDYGVPCIYPQIPGIPPYHNNGVWPFVESYWGLAAAKASNETAFMESIAALARPAALFLTNKENFVASNGDFAGTQVNSSVMLWSISGALGLVYKGLFGMEFQADGLAFRPFVPQALQGTRRLTGFRYRQATLDIELQGFGNVVRTSTLDGQPLLEATVPASLTGRHTLYIELTNEALPACAQNKVAHHVSPSTPVVSYAAGYLSWHAVQGANQYQVLCNGLRVGHTTETSFPISIPTSYTEYQVVAVDALGFESFASEPLPVGIEEACFTFRIEASTPLSDQPDQGYTDSKFIETTTVNPSVAATVVVPATGTYAVDIRYANGNGPINTSNKCAIRTLRINQQFLGTIVLPQRGDDEWADWGFSNVVVAHLPEGAHTLLLSLEPANENMSGDVNGALLDCIRLTKMV
ncbi:alpha-L-rhamnosidase-related protein [Hymenobacter volaticus]|uniref:Glycogen debranching protein n=1 Tax=Hymenobacter volaticus TaxID=2932254 RepID=A0ABY4G7D2_9BACT|nr:glycogen debranching protein [Hymenobacter volaticus]UOQ66529.1 glycogen debranching protein [Hymenobacter volaticus]